MIIFFFPLQFAKYPDLKGARSDHRALRTSGVLFIALCWLTTIHVPSVTGAKVFSAHGEYVLGPDGMG